MPGITGISGNLNDSVVPLLDASPVACSLLTPNISGTGSISGTEKKNIEKSVPAIMEEGSRGLNPEDATRALKDLKVKNVNRIVVGTLNINSLSMKFEQLKLLIGNYLDILIIQETKLDSSFPEGQFLIEGYAKLYQLDRNCNGGGLFHKK